MCNDKALRRLKGWSKESHGLMDDVGLGYGDRISRRGDRSPGLNLFVELVRN